MRELRHVAQRSLSRPGHHLECRVDGRQAYERLAAAPDHLDVLSTDHPRPNMAGLERLGSLRRSPSSRRKIVVLARNSARKSAAPTPS
ncbi:MAG: hypothetical protein CK538_10020 [Opitutia bacterium]|nr:MAG: hypothetical protein CK538_10020 [Opitutae bacterium]